MKPAASLHALMTHVIDYAGMFPPASLSLDDSIRNYARYVKEPDSWMLGRFICPADRLHSLASFRDYIGPDLSAISISVLGITKSGTRGTYSDFAATLTAVREFDHAHHSWARVVALEMRLAADMKVLPEPPPAPVFFETLLQDDWRSQITGLLAEVSDAGETVGFKLRSGGVEAAAFPPPAQLAFAIDLCRQKRVRIKFTAGLHHPIRHFNSSVNTKMHGFINVFGAGVLAYAHALAEDQLLPILLDEDPASFSFDDDGMRWKDLRATTAQIVEARQKLVTSFGSCSFDEPREDLRTLGWL